MEQVEAKPEGNGRGRSKLNLWASEQQKPSTFLPQLSNLTGGLHDTHPV